MGEFHQISNVSSLLVSNLKMDVLFPITTSKRKALSISYFVFVVVCRSLSRHSLVRPSPLRSSHLILSKTSRLKFKTRKESHQISNVSFSLENNWKMVVLSQTTTFKKSPHSILYSV